MARERWTRGVLVGGWLVALAAAAGVSCVGQTPVLSCAQGGDAGEPARLLCADTGGEGTSPVCIDPTVDSRNCGGCGTVCAPGKYCAASACGYPTSCADLLAHVGSDATDGDYLIQPVGRSPFTVYCAGLNTGAPTEYLSLVLTYGHGASATNVSAYNCINCTDAAYTYFEKVRIDPATLRIDETDRTFTTFVTGDPMCWASIGGACASGRTVSFSEAANCLNGASTPGNIDLRGTTFSIDPSVYMTFDGWHAYGQSTFSLDRKVLSFSGGGDCGGIHPDNWNLVLKQD